MKKTRLLLLLLFLILLVVPLRADVGINGALIRPGTAPLTALGQSGATINQVALWNGSVWVPASISTGGGVTGISGPSILSWSITGGIATASYATLLAQHFYVLGTDGSGNVNLYLLTGSYLPTPGASTLGGVQSLTAPAHQWFNSLDTSGIFHASQPAFTDISGIATAAQGGTGANNPGTSGHLLIGQGSTYTDEALSGDVSITSGGAASVLKIASLTLSTLTTGDLLYGSAASTLSRLGIGTTGQVLTVSGGLPVWATPAAGFTNPMTTLGDIIYENATPAAARLAGQTTTTKEYLSQTGNGTISAAPAWAQVGFADLSGNPTPTQLGASPTNNFYLQDVSGTPTWTAVSAGGGTVSSFSAGNLSPLFTTSVATSTTTPALTFSLTNAAGDSWFGNATGSTGPPSYNTSALPVVMGGTGLSSLNQGDILYASAANTLSALAKSTTATQYLSNAGTSNNPKWESLPTAVGAALPSDYISGCYVTIATSGSTFTLNSGSYYEPGSSVLETISTQTITPASPAASTMYYVYGDGSGTITETSTAPTTNYAGTAWEDGSGKRYLGAYFSNSSSVLVAQRRVGNRVYYVANTHNAVLEILANGLATTSTSVSAASITPATCRLLMVQISSNGGAGFGTSDGVTPAGTSGTLVISTSALASGSSDLLVNSSQAFLYCNVSTSNTNVYELGYVEDR